MSKVKELVVQFARFSAVGTTCFLVDYLLMIVFTYATPMDWFWACALSFTISTIINYILSMRFVFVGKEELTRLQEMIIFVALSLVGLGLNQMIMWIISERMHIHIALSKLVTSMIVSIFNYISRKAFLE